MRLEISCKEVANKEDYYDVKIKTYKQIIEGRFERSELREAIENLDNAINVGLDYGDVPILEIKEMDVVSEQIIPQKDDKNNTDPTSVLQ